MTMSADEANGARPKLQRRLASMLGLTASPVFELMACHAAASPRIAAICSSAPVWLPIDEMAAMYLLMSLFHLPLWLRAAPSTRHKETSDEYHDN